MNLLHLKYAVEVAKTNSINKAAENLYMNQPNLSRAIRELEESLGVTLFKRTSRGIVVTREGEEFLTYAKHILRQVDEAEHLFQNRKTQTQCFSVAVPPAAYITEAFSAFVQQLDAAKPMELFLKETYTQDTIQLLLQQEYHLGIIRYSRQQDGNLKQKLEDKGLTSELICEFTPLLTLSQNNPLAQKEVVTQDDLSQGIELFCGEAYTPTLPLTQITREDSVSTTGKRIFTFQSQSQWKLLQTIPGAYCFMPPVPPALLQQYKGVQKPYSSQLQYCDLLVHREHYHLTPYDHLFITQLCDAKRRFMP